ncbi:MAG TPA: hypothetical protein PKK91_07480 [bacterium]|nr:hypothetical protein [bacterium]
MKQITKQPERRKIGLWTKAVIFSAVSVLLLLLQSSAECCTVTNVGLYVGYGPASEEINKTTIYVSYLNQPFYVKVIWDSTPGDFEIIVKDIDTNQTIAGTDNITRTGGSPYQWTNPAINNLATGTYTIKAYVKRKDNGAEG